MSDDPKSEKGLKKEAKRIKDSIVEDDVVQRLTGSFGVTKANGLEQTRQRVNQVWSSLRVLLEAYEQLREDAGLDSLDLEWSDRNMVMGIAAAATRTKSAETRELGDFFTSVAEAMVDAQEKLDTESAAYVQNARGKPHIHPSVFRIPKATAAVKFELDAKEQKKLNLVFHSRSSEIRERHQQSVEFEVLSVPPPPDLVTTTNRTAPSLDVLDDETVRKAIRAAVAAVPSNASNLKNALFGLFERAIIVPGRGPGDVFLCVATQTTQGTPPKPRTNVGVWHLTPAPQPELTVVYGYGRKRADAEDKTVLPPILLALSDGQARRSNDSTAPRLPSAQFILRPSSRDRLFETIRSASASNESALHPEALLRAPNRVLILKGPTSEEFFFAVAHGHHIDRFGVWHLQLHNDTATLGIIYRYNRPPPSKTLDVVAPLYLALDDLCGRQEEFLARER